MPTPDFSKIWASNSPLPAYTFSDADYLTGWDFVGSAPPTKNEFDAWFRMVDEKLNYLYSQLQDTASKLYPVGSIYISFNATDPSTLFGGTWTRLKDRFLLANGDTYPANTTGGSATKTITISNMPSHNHSVNSAGSHTHTATTGSAGSHSHTATTGSAGSHTHTATTSSNGAHTHSRGTMNITGTFSGVGQQYNASVGGATLSGAIYRINTVNNPSQGVLINNGGERDDYFGFDASKSWSGATSSNGSHTHTLTTSSAGAHTHTLTTASAGSHTHTLTTASSGSHTHTTNNTGGSTPLNIMPPYTTVYMWRRTA